MIFKTIVIVALHFIVLSYADLPCNKVKKDYGYVCLCNATYCDTLSRPNQLPPGNFHFYYTSEDSPGFNHETGHFRIQGFSPFGYKYEVNKRKTYQKIRGFGGSFTDSFGAVLNTLSHDAQENLLKSFFSANGIEYTVCRIVIGSSDFSLRNYTYLPNYDPTLSSFNLTEDDHIYKIANIKKAIKMSKKHINFIGSAWMAPSWTKIGNTSDSGYLKPEFRQLWADYHVKALDAYRKEGIEFWALTPGNEPISLFSAKVMSVVIMFPEEQRDWVIDNLGPALEKANYSTKIYVLDDMRIYAIWFMDLLMRDKRIEKYVSGVGLHYYLDFISSIDTLDILHKNYPNQEIIYTESSMNIVMSWLDVDESELKKFSNISKKNMGGPHLGSWKRGGYYARNIIENLNHWTTTYIDWNLALNEAGGPNLFGYVCDASILVNTTNNEFYKQSMFYVMGQFSKFIHSDAEIIDVNLVKTPQDWSTDTRNLPKSEGRTDSSGFPTLPPLSEDIQYIGALNPNGSISIVFYNPKSSHVQIQVHDSDRGHAFLMLEPNSLSTLIYW